MMPSSSILQHFEEPIRSELFSATRLENHGESLARAQTTTRIPHRGKKIFPRIRENENLLEKSYKILLQDAANKRAITPAAEWIIDNFHIIRSQLKDIHDHLPAEYYRELPKLSEGHLQGYPRIYGIAWAFVAHTDSRFDGDLLKRFLQAYQRVQPLTIGELWAISITLRVVMIENLRRLSVRIVGSQLARHEADKIADEVLGLVEGTPRPADKIIEEFGDKPIIAAFAVQLFQRLKFHNTKHDAKVEPLLDWIEKKLAQSHLTPDEIVAIEHSSQTAANASVRNIITSARMMSAFDWQEFFEEVSHVDEIFRRQSNFASMDFATRDRYRQALEELARHSPLNEIQIANKIVSLCKSAEQQKDHDPRHCDPGYYLIASGRFKIESDIQFRIGLRLSLIRAYTSWANGIYLGSILAITVGLSFLTFSISSSPWSIAIGLIAVGLLPASEIAVSIVNRLTIALLGPRHLARLDFEKGIPEQARTFVVVPTMIYDVHKIDAQLEQLEIHYLANASPNLYFALLTDFLDSNSETTAKDAEILASVHTKLHRLNQKYSAQGQENLFYVFHRRRLWNPQEGAWMGWERKRGKLHEFNRLLMGDKTTSHISLDGKPIPYPSHIKYIITLDADTRLPNGSAAQLVGTLAHPLNRPRYDENLGRVVGGYGLLQPRVTPSLPSEIDSTLFQKLSTGDAGIDPYASAVSDIYQDLFAEGSYTGKGIYDLEIFEKALGHRIPENSLLSHDLFEGNYVRCGFLSDVEFFEEFPSHSEVSVARSHRWTRGDWQLLPWLLGRGGKSISLLGRWKIFDNLRRSLIAPALFVLLVLCFALDLGQTYPWAILVFFGLSIHAFINFFVELFPVRRHLGIVQHLHAVFTDWLEGMGRFLMAACFLPHHAWMNLDAIGRALYRMLVSKKKLLEWTTAAQARAAANLQIKGFLKGFSGALILTTLAAISIATLQSRYIFEALPLFLVWFGAPLIAYKVSSPPKPKLIKPLSSSEVQYYELVGRQIWHFFSTFVTAQDHYLPPDNFQEDPTPVVAHRSSPTNFGLYLLSTVAAKDFGWIGTSEMAERLEQTLQSMSRLPKHEGHFYNWYETSEARALDPKYISSVDNGNLAGHLLAIGQSALESIRHPFILQGYERGFANTLALTFQALEKIDSAEEKSKALEALFKIKSLAAQNDWSSIQDEITRLKNYVSEKNIFTETDFSSWVGALDAQAQSVVRDLDLFSWLYMDLPSLDGQLSSEIAAKWTHIRERLKTHQSLQNISGHCEMLLHDLAEIEEVLFQNNLPKNLTRDTLAKLKKSLLDSQSKGQLLEQKLLEIHQLCHQMFHAMDFGLLYDQQRKLFSIGYRVADHALDNSYYDLLASEARLTSFIAIAKGDVPASHWFRLGRSLTAVRQGNVLVSWSGSMFEYLMPALVMDTPESSLVDQTCRLVVQRQIDYGQQRGTPWGISESAYNKRDLHLTYQYSNFGIPDLGLKRGLGGDLVIAPYASMLASMYDAVSAVANLERIERSGGRGLFGFYEAIDYTYSRLPEGQNCAVIKAYMAHHQGMGLIAIANIFKRGNVRRRFHADPLVQAAELLLQERMPRNVSISKPAEENFHVGLVKEETEHVSRRYHTVNRPVPTTQLLSNGEYSVMLSSSGSGYSRFKDLAVTRWREDVTRDNYGSYIYLRDLQGRNVWSAGYQPVCSQGESYEVSFYEDRARFKREDYKILSDLEIFVSPEDNVEIRRLCLTNLDEVEREIEVTSYAEVVLNQQNADAAHPAFSNLFVQTEYHADLKTLLASRRPRSAKEHPVWAAHVLVTDTCAFGDTQYETDRAKFLGRNREVRNPQSVFDLESLSHSVGAVLDPIFSLRTKIHLAPGASSHVLFYTLVAPDREGALVLADKFQDKATYERVTDLAWIQSQVRLHYLNIEPDEAHLFQRLATRLLYLDSSLRPAEEIIRRNRKDVTGLWGQGISGDHPIVLIRIDDFEDRGIVRQLLKAFEYLSHKGLVHDLVILNEKSTSYSQELQNSLESLVHNSMMNATSSVRGKVFIVRSEFLSAEDKILLFASARVILASRQGSLSDQVKRMRMSVDRYSYPSNKISEQRKISPSRMEIPDLDFFNGYGGFTKDGREYAIVLRKNVHTPAPWINVIANPHFGFQVSESGSGYTWAENSRENQITPWKNDPVSDPNSECFYILDQDSKALWSPTASPIRHQDATYITYHGQGYSRFEHYSHGIRSELTQFVTWDRPVKVSKLVLTNESRGPRKLSIASYVEWVLGFSRSTMALTNVTEFDGETGAIFTSNSRSNEYNSKTYFFVPKLPSQSYTADRSEFIGRNGNLANPAGLNRENGFSNHVGAGLDPCAAFLNNIHLPMGESVEISFFLGQAESANQAREMIHKIRSQNLNELLDNVKENWSEILEQVQVQTPDQSMNLMLNRWLLYQTQACRFWARAAFYQAGGAYGFRDQLQDSMALVLSQPQLVRQHILRAASRQFVEGDVQHWWHPPYGRGVRTHFSDDLVWLPFVVSYYLEGTQDWNILDAPVSFLEGPLLRPDQEDSYYTPNISHNTAPLYEHCARALDRSLATGKHGLPLIGAGDWNDGMNRVGHAGQGESVWLAWFLFLNLNSFAKIAEKRGDSERAKTWRAHAEKLRGSVEQNAWDGAWYRRAYFDDGTPIGSATQAECRIDSIAQTWAILSGAGNSQRARKAMESVEEYLINEKNQIILLFTPAFDKTSMDPGYIKGYLPGVRENGGQYTHAAIWCVMAYANLGEGNKATNLFSILNPIQHAKNPNEVQRYKVEPYVMAADIYSQAPYTGRGGWTWYTGSCGWMYRAGLESILGFRVLGNELDLNPCVPDEWQEFKISYRHHSAKYEITFHKVSASNKVTQVEIDGTRWANTRRIPLTDDGKVHQVFVQLGSQDQFSADN